MSYNTELMEQILTSPEAQTIINYVSPIYGDSYVGLWLFQVIGMQLDKTRNWAETMVNEVTPQTATWTIEYWEDEYGIPHDPDMTLEQRRRALMARMQYRAPMPPKKLEDIIGNITSAPCEINENTGQNEFEVVLRAYIGTTLIKKVKAAVNQAKPAHLIYKLRIAELEEFDIDIFAGIAISQFETMEMEVPV